MDCFLIREKLSFVGFVFSAEANCGLCVLNRCHLGRPSGYIPRMEKKCDVELQVEKRVFEPSI